MEKMKFYSKSFQTISDFRGGTIMYLIHVLSLIKLNIFDFICVLVCDVVTIQHGKNVYFSYKYNLYKLKGSKI